MPVTVDVFDDRPLPRPEVLSAIIEAGATGTAVTLAAEPAMLSNIAFGNSSANTNLAAQNAVANQQALNEVGVSALGKAVAMIVQSGPLNTASVTELMTGDTVAEEIADLKAALTGLNPAIPNTNLFPIPLPPAPQTIYANAPLYLVYDNDHGAENLHWLVRDDPSGQ
jgi:hypothetical protein